MQRRRLLVAAFAVLMHWQAAYAQSTIDVPATVELGQPIVASVTLPEGGKVAWKAGPGVSLIDVGEGKAHLWAQPGTGSIEAVVVSVKDGQLGSLDWLSATFQVGPAPTPVPPTPVPPGPTPPPVPPGPLPEPVPGTLAALVPADARLPLAEFYGDWAKTIRAGSVTSTGQFRAAHQQSMKALQDVLDASGWAAINKPISDRIAASVGLEDATLDAAKREALAVALDSIAAEFKGG